MMFFYPKEDILKISCPYLNWKCENLVLTSLLEVCQERWFLTGHMMDRVIPDILNHVYLPLGRYLENLVLISLLEVCQEGGVLGGCWGFQTGDVEDMVIPDVMNDVFLPQGR